MARKRKAAPSRPSNNLPVSIRFPDQAELPCMEMKLTRLTGELVDLLPLRYADIPDIERAARQASIFKWFIDGWLILRLGVAAYVQKLVNEQEAGDSAAFSVFHRRSRRIIGITRFYHVRKRDHALSVATWYAKDFHGSGVNVESKLLLLRHAFEVMHCRRVQFEIDVHNKVSIAATKGIGARCEGRHEEDIMLADGYQRTSVIYAITHKNWPAARRKMERKLKRIYAEAR